MIRFTHDGKYLSDYSPQTGFGNVLGNRGAIAVAKLDIGSTPRFGRVVSAGARWLVTIREMANIAAEPPDSTATGPKGPIVAVEKRHRLPIGYSPSQAVGTEAGG